MGDSREQIEELWRNRLADAKLRLDFARNYLNEFQQALPLDHPSPGGYHVFQRALRAENIARAEFHRILRLYTALVMDGKIPDERRKDACA